MLADPVQGPVQVVSSGLELTTSCWIPAGRSWDRRRGVWCEDLLNVSVVNDELENPSLSSQMVSSALLLRLIPRSVTRTGT